MENQTTSTVVQKPRRKNKSIYIIISLIAVAMNDEDYIQSYARGKYSVSKEGEQVFYLSPLDK